MRVGRIWAFVLAAYSPVWCEAALDPTDTVQILPTLSMGWDSNLYRLPNADSSLFGIDSHLKSDNFLVKGLGLRLDKTISRQRFLADVNVHEQTYNKNDNLDFFGGEGKVSWLWQAGNYWNGEASYRRARTLGGFADFRAKVQDLIDTESYFVSAGYLFHPSWRIGVDASEIDSTHSANIRQTMDYDAHVLGAELRYQTAASNMLTLRARRTDRNYPNRTVASLSTIDNGHQEMRYTAVGEWQLTGLSRFEGQVGYVDVEHDKLSQRDFSGMTWRASGIWDTSGSLRVTAKVFRDIRLYEDIATSFIKATGVSLSPVYAITPKVFVQADLNYEKRDFRGDPGFTAIAEDRQDKVKTARVGLVYNPIRNVDLSFTYEVGKRRSNINSPAIVGGRIATISINDYDYESWFATLRVGF